MAKYNKSLAEEVRKNMGAWYGNNQWRANVANYKSKTKFVMGEQWSDDEKLRFSKTKTMPLTVNKLFPLVNNVIGEYIKITPNMQVIAKNQRARDAVGSVETAQALFKRIAFNSDSKSVYRTAAKNAARGGWGVIRIVTEYESEKSFNQEIKIKEVKDPTSCFFDTFAKTSAKTDGDFCGMYSIMRRKSFEAKYPGLKLEEAEAYDIPGMEISWCGAESVTIVDYYKKVKTKTKLLHVVGNMLINEGDYFESELKRRFSKEIIETFEVTDSKDAEEIRVKHYRIAGDHILSETEFPCDELPLVFVDQESWYDGSEQVTRAIIEDAEDTQRFINYLASLIAKLIKMQKHGQWLATKPMIANNSEQWADVESVEGALLYDPDPMSPNPMPQKVAPPEISQSLFVQYQRCSEDIHAITGIFATQIGNEGNEISGTAIAKRAEQANTSNISFFVNVNSSISKVGQIILKMLPKVYDTQRAVMIESQFGGYKQVVINQQHGDMSLKNDIINNEYDLAVDASLSFDGQKHQALESLTMLLQTNPLVMVNGQQVPLFSVIGDLYAENLPLQNTAELTNRIRDLIVSKEAIAAGKGEKLPQQQPNQAQQAQQQMMAQQMQIAQAKLQTEQGKVANQQTENQLKAQELQLEARQQELEAQNMEIKAQMNQLTQAMETVRAVINHTNSQQERAHHFVKNIERSEGINL